MGLISRIAERRNRQITERARPYLETNDEVVDWARVRHPDRRRQGYAFLTVAKFVIHWTDRRDGQGAFRWDEICAWGVDDQAEGGPLLGVETNDSQVFVHMPATSHMMAGRVTEFLRRFAQLAPKPGRSIAKNGHRGRFEAHPEVEVSKEKKTVAAHTRRVVLTVIGVVLLLVGFVLSLPLVPGPGILVMLAGLALLASEYDWAQDVLLWARERSAKAARRLRSGRSAD